MKTKDFTVRLPKDVDAALQRDAERNDRSKHAQLVRVLKEKYNLTDSDEAEQEEETVGMVA